MIHFKIYSLSGVTRKINLLKTRPNSLIDTIASNKWFTDGKFLMQTYLLTDSHTPNHRHS